MLTLDESLEMLNIPKARFVLADSVAKAQSASKRFGFPVVLKLVSPRVIHKTEAKGVRVARSPADVKAIAAAFLRKGSVLVQEQVDGVEFFLGIKLDPSFGHVLLAGIGGIFVEVYKDISFRVCPITKKDASAMLDELKGKAVLEGVRGAKPVDKKKLIDAMVNLSQLPKSFPNIEELDVNPLFVNERGVKAVDARIVLKD